MGSVHFRGLVPLIFLAGCAAIATSGQFQSGRNALLVNDSEAALPYFRSVAEQNPNYVFQSMDFREGIWTYVGRTQYDTKRYAEARKSLERALAQDPNDNMARLYLGLTLARSGEESRGIKEIEAGMKGIYDFIEYMNRSRPMQSYWDPLGTIRSQIDKDLANMSSRDADIGPLLTDAEWLGATMEQEVDNVRRDERRELDRPVDPLRGFGFGIGIGF